MTAYGIISDPLCWVVGYFFIKSLWLAIFPRGSGADKELRDAKREQLKRQAKL